MSYWKYRGSLKPVDLTKLVLTTLLVSFMFGHEYVKPAINNDIARMKRDTGILRSQKSHWTYEVPKFFVYDLPDHITDLPKLIKSGPSLEAMMESAYIESTALRPIPDLRSLPNAKKQFRPYRNLDIG